MSDTLHTAAPTFDWTRFGHLSMWAVQELGARCDAPDTGLQHFPGAYADEARGWIADCEWHGLDTEEAEHVSGTLALLVVTRDYDGALASFADAVWC